jgi:hypothetical protein
MDNRMEMGARRKARIPKTEQIVQNRKEPISTNVREEEKKHKNQERRSGPTSNKAKRFPKRGTWSLSISSSSLAFIVSLLLVCRAARNQSAGQGAGSRGSSVLGEEFALSCRGRKKA